jgi:hypothetical protein
VPELLRQVVGLHRVQSEALMFSWDDEVLLCVELAMEFGLFAESVEEIERRVLELRSEAGISEPAAACLMVESFPLRLRSLPSVARRLGASAAPV